MYLLNYFPSCLFYRDYDKGDQEDDDDDDTSVVCIQCKLLFVKVLPFIFMINKMENESSKLQ